MRAFFGTVAIFSSFLVTAHAAAPQRPLYVVVGEATEPDGQTSSFAKELFVERLRERPDVTLDAPAWLPEGPSAIRLALHSHGMRAYNASLKIESTKSELLPVPGNPNRATLTYSARVRIYGFTIPDRQLRIGGEGEAEISVVVSVGNADATRERISRQVIDSAMQEAMRATVEQIRVVAARERASR